MRVRPRWISGITAPSLAVLKSILPCNRNCDGRRRIPKTALVAFIFAALVIAEQAEATPILWNSGAGNTGHWYEVISAPSGITWADAQADALSRGGYLATILSPEENTFVFGLINLPTYWIVESSGS